jgi:acyl dehydratase
MAAKVSFDSVNVGDEVFSDAKVVKRENIKAYADASGDQNPLHQVDSFAQSVGFPGIIGHGMYSMAHLTNALSDWVGDPAAVKSIKVQFRAVVYMDETLTAKGKVVAKDDATKEVTLELWEELERDGAVQNPIKNSSAVVQLS